MNRCAIATASLRETKYSTAEVSDLSSNDKRPKGLEMTEPYGQLLLRCCIKACRTPNATRASRWVSHGAFNSGLFAGTLAGIRHFAARPAALFSVHASGHQLHRPPRPEGDREALLARGGLVLGDRVLKRVRKKLTRTKAVCATGAIMFENSCGVSTPGGMLYLDGGGDDYATV